MSYLPKFGQNPCWETLVYSMTKLYWCDFFVTLELGQRYLFTAAKPYPDIQICAGNLDGGKDACQVLIMFYFFLNFKVGKVKQGTIL